MIQFQIGFLLFGLINNYNFIVIFSCAYALTREFKYINSSLLILFEILPGFLTQLLYPIYLHKIPYSIRWCLLFVSQLISSLLLILVPDKIAGLFGAVALISFNSYFGESTMLSLSSKYEKKELKFWSIGTGLASILGTGVYLLLHLWIAPSSIFLIHLFFYVFGLSLALFLIHYQYENTVQVNEIELSYSDLSQNTIQESEYSLVQFFKEIHLLVISYFFAYCIGFSYIPLLVPNDLHYEILQFITRTFLFIGRTSGNYLTWMPGYILDYIHLYTIILIVIFTFLLAFHVEIHYLILAGLLTLSYLNIGICYPVVYHQIYEKYPETKEWKMGAVGRFTSFATILGCSIGYLLQIGFQ